MVRAEEITKDHPNHLLLVFDRRHGLLDVHHPYYAEVMSIEEAVTQINHKKQVIRMIICDFLSPNHVKAKATAKIPVGQTLKRKAAEKEMMTPDPKRTLLVATSYPGSVSLYRYQFFKGSASCRRPIATTFP